jgi:crotonobetainyl-CoA:carnitine CoA-transferase CaiB-like acyl-CoA transferase
MMANEENNFFPLAGLNVVLLAVNVPGPVAAAELQRLGASITKVEPPGGDPLSEYSSEWYRLLTVGQKVITSDLKKDAQRKKFDELLERADLLVTSLRPSALKRLSLEWSELHAQFPKLSQVAIVGYAPPKENIAGHDLTYQAGYGLLSPPDLPKTLLSDLAAAEMVVSAALALFLHRERTGIAHFTYVAIAKAAERFAAPLRYGLTTSGSLLGGGIAGYNLYQTAQGWIALAALEPHFLQRLLDNLDTQNAEITNLEGIFLTKTAAEWETWAKARDIPIIAVTNLSDEKKATYKNTGGFG